MQVSINHHQYELPEGTTILDAIKTTGNQLVEPHLGPAREWIYSSNCPQLGMAECNGQIVTLPALMRRSITRDMVIETNNQNIQTALDDHGKQLIEKHECFMVSEWQKFVAVEAESTGFINYKIWEKQNQSSWLSWPSISHDPRKCVHCKACIDTCTNIQGVSALSFDNERGIVIDDNACVRCGQCIHHCPMGATNKNEPILNFLNCQGCAFARPMGAMHEVDETQTAWELLHDKTKYCVVQFAPSIRSSLGEEFGLPSGELDTKKIYAALRRLGFQQVWDTNFAADLTIMEEGTELLNRYQTQGILPMFTSCCPGWVRFVEMNYPDLIPHLSTAKSPQQMFGAVSKTIGAISLTVDPREMCVISIMPCTAKKYERTRPEMTDAAKYWREQANTAQIIDYPDVDLVLTTREFSRLLKMAGIDLAAMPEENADPLFAEYSGAAPIFGRTGGVMEAALRTASAIYTGETPQTLEFDSLGTEEGIKRAKISLGNTDIQVAVAHGLKNAREICESIRNNGEFSTYKFIEFMACPGGCIGGGGQPIPTDATTRLSRTRGLNQDDRSECAIRMSHENPEIKAVYDNFLGKPLSHLSHKLLHTQYGSDNLSIMDPNAGRSE
jgi:iron-only hydrogenase group A